MEWGGWRSICSLSPSISMREASCLWIYGQWEEVLACAEKVRPSFIVTNHWLDVIQTLSRSQSIHTTPSTKRILRQCHSLYLVSKNVATSLEVPLENYLAPLQQFVQPTLVHTSKHPSSKILNLYGTKELGIGATTCSRVRVPDFFSAASARQCRAPARCNNSCLYPSFGIHSGRP